jgi:hypothetical protein
MVDRAQTHQPVRFRRSDGRFESTAVDVLKGEYYVATRLDRRDAVDIRPWLLTLWKEAPLVEFFKKLTAPPVAPPSPVTPPVDPYADAPPELVSRVRGVSGAGERDLIVPMVADALNLVPDGEHGHEGNGKVLKYRKRKPGE